MSQQNGATKNRAFQPTLDQIIWFTWIRILEMCKELESAGLESPYIKVSPLRNSEGTTLGVTFKYWVGEALPDGEHSFALQLNGEIAYCEGPSIKKVKLQLGKEQELLLILNRIQYILAHVLNKPAEDVQRYLEWIAKAEKDLATHVISATG